jgi:hypothetical protein
MQTKPDHWLSWTSLLVPSGIRGWPGLGNTVQASHIASSGSSIPGVLEGHAPSRNQSCRTIGVTSMGRGQEQEVLP